MPEPSEIQLFAGDPAPEFRASLSSPDAETQEFSLANARGQRVALCFYPSDDLPSGLLELACLRDVYPRLGELARVLGISADAPEVQKRHITRLFLPFELLSDPGNAIAQSYGLWLGPGGDGDAEGGSSTERATFIINAEGFIEAIMRGATPTQIGHMLVGLLLL